MRVAVCCPGPSLPTTWRGRTGSDLVYAVNRALLVIDADWLCAGDIAFFQNLLGDSRPRIGTFTMRDNCDAFRKIGTWGVMESWEEAPGFIAHRAIRPVQWSMQAALIHASDKGALSIDLYGCDMRDRTDCTGYDGENRNPERWAREAEDLKATLIYLQGRGVAVTRK